MSDDTIIGTQDKIRSHTIKVTDSYTLDADDTLKLKGNIGFKLLASRDGPVDLTINGAVTMAGDGHLKMVGVVSTNAPNGVAHVTLGDDASLTLTNDAGASSLGAIGVALQAAVSSIDNEGDIHVTAANGSTLGVGAEGTDLSLDNAGDIHATALGVQAVGALLSGENVTLVNSGSIETDAEAGRALGIAAGASVSGTLLNDGDVTVSGLAAYGVEAVGLFTSVINNGDLTVTCTAPAGAGVGAIAAGLAVSGGLLGGSVIGYGAVENNGDIQVMGGGGAAAGVVVYGATGFHNTGHILATSSSVEATPFHSAGLLVVLGTGAVTTNDGVISGEYSIVTDASFGGGGSFTSDDIIVNSATGQLIGDVEVGAGNDSLTNAGSIQGDVTLGDGDDTFDNQAGTMAGAVTGGLGADTLTGGAGADHFTYTAVADSDAVHSDLITGLGAGDLIDLAMIDADTVTDGDQAFHLVGAFSNAAGELTVSYDAGTDLTTIAGDANGDGVADLVITASGDHHDFTGFVL